MAFTDAERVQVRRWLGASFLFQQHEPRVESAMDSVETLPDGGATEDYITDTLLVRLEAAFAELVKLEAKMMALTVDEVTIDPVRAMQSIRSMGRMYSSQLATSLGLIGVLQDAWSMIEPDPSQTLGTRPR